MVIPTPSVTPDVLPDSRSRSGRGAVMGPLGFMQPIFCASCGCEGGLVTEDAMTFAFWLCNDCFATYGELTGMMVMPDEVFWRQVHDAQMAKYGRIPTAEEVRVLLADPESLESTLARSKAAMTPKACW